MGIVTQVEPDEVSNVMAEAWREDFRADLQALLDKHAPRRSFFKAVAIELRAVTELLEKDIEEVPPIRSWP